MKSTLVSGFNQLQWKTLSLYFLALMICFSCKKTEQTTPIVDNPLKLETIGVDAANKKTIVFAGRVLYLNSEKIKDHGFLLKSGFGASSTEKKYALGDAVQIGKVQTKIETPAEVLETGVGTYRFYIETDKNTYFGETVRFQLSNFLVDYQMGLSATAGETITVNGDFKDFNKESYKLSYDFNNPKEVAYNIDATKRKVTFVVPAGYRHGVDLSFSLTPIQPETNFNSSIGLASVRILGTLAPPTSYNYNYDDYLRLSGTGLPPDRPSSFYVIIGDKLFPYSQELLLSDMIYDQPKTAYRIGYYNGRDTVIFDKKITLNIPKPTDLSIRQSHVHPGRSISVTGIIPYKYSFMPIMSVGDKSARYSWTWNGDDKITIGDIPDGSYPFIMEGPFAKFESKEKIVVQSLKVTDAGSSKGYYGTSVKILGNFIRGDEYIARLGDQGDQNLQVANGSAVLEIPNIKPGKVKITVIYNDDHGKQHTVPTDHQIEVLAPIFDDFYPKSGKPGDVITLKGKGLGYCAIYMGDVRLISVGGTVDEPQVFIPRNIFFKGKVRISAQYQSDWIECKETFELL